MTRIVKTFVASGAIGHRRQVKATATDGVVTLATAATDDVIGVTDHPGGAADGGRIDVVLFGPAEVEGGGAIAFGKLFTSDATGRAVAAAPAAGINNGIGGRTLVTVASGDFFRAFVNPTRIQG